MGPVTEEIKNSAVAVAPISSERAELEVRLAEEMLGKSQAVLIRTIEDKVAAVSLLADVKQRIKKLEEERKKATGPLDDAKKVIMGWFRKPEVLYVQAESVLKVAVLAYDEKERKAREAEQRRLDEEARKMAAKEKEKLLKKAEKAEARGDAEGAEVLKEQATTVEVLPTIAKAVPKVEGIHTREDWKAEVVDASLLPREYLIPNFDALSKLAKAMKGEIKIPGVRFYSEKVVVVKG